MWLMMKEVSNNCALYSHGTSCTEGGSKEGISFAVVCPSSNQDGEEDDADKDMSTSTTLYFP